MSEYNLGTKCVQGGYTPGNGEPRQVPIIQSTTFKYSTSEDMGKLFDLEASGYFYTRLQNPTNDTVAAKIADLEGGSAAMLTSSEFLRGIQHRWLRRSHRCLQLHLRRHIQPVQRDHAQDGRGLHLRQPGLHRG